MSGGLDAEVSQLSRVAGCDCVGRPAAAASRAQLDARAFARARTDSEARRSSPPPIDNDTGPVHAVRRPCTAPPLDRCSPPSPFRDRAAESPPTGKRERERERERDCDRPAYAHSSYAAQARSEPELARHVSAGRSTVDVGVQHTPTVATIAVPDADRDADEDPVRARRSRHRTERRSMGVQTLRDPPAPPPPPPATAASAPAPTGTSASTCTASAATNTTPPPPLPARQVPPHAPSAPEKRPFATSSSRRHGVETASDQSCSPFSEPPTPSAVPKAAASKRNESNSHSNSKETLKSPTLEKTKSVSSTSGSISIPSPPQSERGSKSNLAPSSVEPPAASSSTVSHAPEKTVARGVGTSDGAPCAASAGDASSKATAAPPPVPSSTVSTSTSKLSTAKANANSTSFAAGAGAAQSTLLAASAADAHSCGAVQPQSRPVSRADELPSVAAAAVKLEPVTVDTNAVHSPLTAHRTLSPASSVGLQRSKSSATSLLVVATLAPTSSTPLPPNEPPAALPRVPTVSGGLSLLKHKLSTATGVSFLSGSSTLQERERLERQGRRRSMEVLLNEIYECRRLLLEEKLAHVLQVLPNNEPDAARAASRACGAQPPHPQQHQHQHQHQHQQQECEADAGDPTSIESGIERAACAATATAVALSKCNSVLERDAKTAARIAARLTDKGLKGSTTDPDGPAAVRHWVRKYVSARSSLRIKVIFLVSFS